MSKPTDISQEAWDASIRTARMVMAGEGFKTIEALDRVQSAVTVIIARAILAAKAEEREACAQVADANMNNGPLDAAAAIRKRGEANVSSVRKTDSEG